MQLQRPILPWAALNTAWTEPWHWWGTWTLGCIALISQVERFERDEIFVDWPTHWEAVPDNREIWQVHLITWRSLSKNWSTASSYQKQLGLGPPENRRTLAKSIPRSESKVTNWVWHSSISREMEGKHIRLQEVPLWWMHRLQTCS